MLIGIDIRGITRIRDDLGRIMTSLPKAVRKDTQSVANVFSKELRREIKARRLIWNWTLYNSTKPIMKKNGYDIKLPKYAFYLDSMQPHWVGVYDKPELKDWASEKLGFIPRYMYVKPHPFINYAFDMARLKIDEKLEHGKINKLFR
jgi:hypothetical protein